MASILDLVRHYQRTIEKHPNDEQKVLRCIDNLFNLGVTVQHLQETGVGRTVNALRKEPGDVGHAARSLVYKWKLMVAAEESDQEADQTNDTTTHNGHGSGKESDDNTQSRSRSHKYERSNSTSKSNDRREVNGYHSGSKRKYQSSEEEEQDNKRSKHSSSSEDDYKKKSHSMSIKTEPGSDKKSHSVSIKAEPESDSYDDSDNSQSDESDSEESESSQDEDIKEEKIKEEIKKENSISHKSSSKHLSQYDNSDRRSTSKKPHESDKHSRHHSTHSKEKYSSEKSSSKDNGHSSEKHISLNEESNSEKKHRKDLKLDAEKNVKESKSSARHSSSEKNSGSEKQSSSDKHRTSDKHSSSERNNSSNKHSSSEKHRSSDKHSSSEKNSSSEKHMTSSSQKLDGGSDKHKVSSDKHSKSDKHKSSSHEKEKHKNSSEKESKHKTKESSSNSSSSKEKHSSSSKDKSKDRSSSTKEKSSSHSSEKKHSSSSDNKSSSSSSKSNSEKNDEKSNDKKSKHKSSSSSHKSGNSSSKKEDVPKKKVQIQNSEDSDDGIDCGSGASFAQALGMISPAKPKKKQLRDASSPNTDMSPAALLAPSAKLVPLPALEISALPEISPNYKPRAPPKPLPHFNDEDAMNALISSKNQRTKVYSGNKVIGKVTSLYEMCVHVLQEHIDALEYTGGVPYEILKPVVDRATPQQLFLLEHYNPYLMEDTDHLWQKFCIRNFRNKQRHEMETWREMYTRCQEEQEIRLKSLTANIRIAQEAKKAPIKQTKMAYVDSVAKPPRNIAKKQAQHGTARAATGSPAARVASLAAAPNVLRGGAVRPLGAPPTTSSSFKPKKAPLMAKALQIMRGRKR